LTRRVEALLIATDRPLSEARLAELLGLTGKDASTAIGRAVQQLNESYDGSDRAFRIERLAGGFQILTVERFGPLLARLHRDRQRSRLSPAALETLAIIAYRQPILRAEIEAIRGVACGEVLRGLLERRLVKITGRAEELGRPMLYGTTREFLHVFGLATLDDLPPVEGEPSRRGRAARSAQATSAETEATAAGSEEAPADAVDESVAS
jgi:segregation and condensation protein B